MTSPQKEKEEAEKRAEKLEKQRNDWHSRVDNMLKSQSQFELYKDKSEKYRWRLRHKNSNIIADSSQGYSTKQKAQQGLQAVRRDSIGANIIDMDLLEKDINNSEGFISDKDSQSVFELYKDSNKYHWRLKHKNGNVIACSSQGYSSKQARNAAIEKIRDYALISDYLHLNPAEFEVYIDKNNKFRWKLIHRNGRILARGGQGYSSRQKVNQGIQSVRENIEENKAKIEFYEDNESNYRWRIRHNNGNIIASSSRSYQSEPQLESSFNKIKKSIKSANTLDISIATFELYQDPDDEYRWNLRHKNGIILCSSGSGYSSLQGAKKSINSIKRNIKYASIQGS